VCSKQTRERGEKVKLKLFVILWGLVAKEDIQRREKEEKSRQSPLFAREKAQTQTEREREREMCV
jgi:hypothetical protein